jgi:hypothetical protein
VALLAVHHGDVATMLETAQAEDLALLADLLESPGVRILANGELVQEIALAILELPAPIFLQETFPLAFDEAAAVFLELQLEVVTKKLSLNRMYFFPLSSSEFPSKCMSYRRLRKP